jgi:hypothetical protein
MFYPVIVMLKGAAGVVGRVYVDTFYLAGKFLFQGFEGRRLSPKIRRLPKMSFLPVRRWAW